MYHSLQKLLNQENSPADMSQETTKEEFLAEHNKLSPLNLKATTALLSRFRIEKSSMFKADDWPIDKLRRPFILWLTSLPLSERGNIHNKKA